MSTPFIQGGVIITGSRLAIEQLGDKISNSSFRFSSAFKSKLDICYLLAKTFRFNVNNASRELVDYIESISDELNTVKYYNMVKPSLVISTVADDSEDFGDGPFGIFVSSELVETLSANGLELDYEIVAYLKEASPIWSSGTSSRDTA